jgi:ATP/ADP translocase
MQLSFDHRSLVSRLTSHDWWRRRLGTSPLMLAVMIGAAQNILSKGAKYSLFDPCKEMAYIPLGG